MEIISNNSISQITVWCTRYLHADPVELVNLCRDKIIVSGRQEFLTDIFVFSGKHLSMLATYENNNWKVVLAYHGEAH